MSLTAGIKKLFYCILALGVSMPQLAFAAVLRDGNNRPVRRGGKYDPRQVNIIPMRARRGEFRGVWVCTVENLDFPRVKSAAEFRSRYIAMVNRIAAAGFNAIIFQVRPNADAFYPSQLVPYSSWLTGVEGRGLNFDMLQFMVTEAHARRLEFHAWFNPYRVINGIQISKNAYLKKLHPKNFARKNPHLVLDFHNGKSRSLFFDPGRKEVVSHICKIVSEVASRYDIDGIHFDDYFYPYDEIGAIDNHTFARNNPYRLSKADWRRRNTETLIYNVKLTIDRINLRRHRKIRFGVSPFGIWGNAKDIRGGSATGGKQTYFNLYADTRKWVQKRYVDYIVPQIYWHFAHETAAYAALTSWWSSTVRNTGVKLYIGMAPYRLGAPGWGRYELVNQLYFNRMHPEVAGMCCFSYRHLFGNKTHAGVKAFLQALRK
ncbi:MAG: family 10 glycosylhydrolase [Lentisphaeria bacterium]|nr:family 10 glycosylhydrolase [Lentisphaeria bacterium]